MSFFDRFKQGFNTFKGYLPTLLGLVMESNILTAILLSAVRIRTLPVDTTPWEKTSQVVDLVLPEIPEEMFDRYGKGRFSEAIDLVIKAMGVLHTGKVEQREGIN